LAVRTADEYVPFDGANYLNRKTGRVRARYAAAHRDLLRDGFQMERDSDIKGFVKLERYFDETKAPRMILGRNPKFNVMYAQIIEPIETAFFKLDEVANGKDHHSMGEAFAKIAGRCRHFVENDMSKYESSQRFTVLKIEFLFYYKLLKLVEPSTIPLLYKAYAMCLVNKVKTSVGVMFSFILCRVSGDLTTSLGNGVINLITTQYNQIMNTCDYKSCGLDLCQNPHCRMRDILVKGDDGVLGRNPNQKFENYYKCFGLDAKIVLKESADEVEFCSGGFIEVGGDRYVYVQKLQKLIESLTTCINQDALDHGWVSQYYQSLGLMYKVVYRGVPIYEAIADFLLQTNPKLGVNTNLVSSYNLLDAYQAEHHAVPIDSSTARLSVSLVNQMDYAELNRIETWMRSNRLEFPEHLKKRCNTKNVKAADVPTIDFKYLNDQFMKSNLTKDVQNWHNKLVGLSRVNY